VKIVRFDPSRPITRAYWEPNEPHESGTDGGLTAA